jgi:hypothetical protein
MNSLGERLDQDSFPRRLSVRFTKPMKPEQLWTLW